MANYEYSNAFDERNNALGLMPKHIGTSADITAKPLDQLKAKIFEGASHVELGFSGQGKGSIYGKQTTPGMVSKEEREATRQLAKLNEVTMTTHAPVGVSGFSGQSKDGFDELERIKNINEIKRTIDFAADVTGGGSVTIHSGEFPRNISALHNEFEEHEGALKESVEYLIDPITGKMINVVKGNEQIWNPKQKSDANGNLEWLRDQNGDKIKEYGEDIPIYDIDKKGDMIMEAPITFNEFRDNAWKKNDQLASSGIAKDFFKLQQQGELSRALGTAKEYEMRYSNALEERQKIKNSLIEYEEIKQGLIDNGRESDWEYRKKEISSRDPFIGNDNPNKEDPIEWLKKELNENERQIAYSREQAVAARKDVSKSRALIERVQSLQEYGVAKTAESFADLAEYAIIQETQKKLDKEIVISPENMFPEYGYGSHPDELKKLVVAARDKFVENNTKKYGEKKASELAKSHIKSTMDIGHAFTWRKYFKPSDKAKGNLEATDQEFRDWFLGQIDELNKDDIIGHVHVSDNFGFEDEHLTPGQGMIGEDTFKKFIEKMKKKGIENVIVEAGAQGMGQEWRAMVGGWSTFGSSIYGAHKSWDSVQSSYFGHTAPPTHIFGDYSPSEEFRGNPFYSGLGLE